MEFTDFSAGNDDEGKRLDRILKKILKNRPSSGIYSALRKKYITLNGTKAGPEKKVKSGDIINVSTFLLKNTDKDTGGLSKAQVSVNKSGHLENKSEDLRHESINVIFRNSNIAALNKPYGIPVQPSKGAGISLAELVRQMLPPQRESLSFTPAPLHRLDRWTTGVILVSQSARGASWALEAFKNHRIKKVYIGVAEGLLEEKEVWEDTIDAQEEKSGGNRGDNRKEGFHTVTASKSGNCAKNAVTEARPLAYGKYAYGDYKEKDITLAEYSISTGRKHQIRAQSALHGHPLLGDTAYGGERAPFMFLLHALRMEFESPNDAGLPERIEAPLPPLMAEFLKSNLIKWCGEPIIQF